ncbi:S9 family peptidase [Streptomyces marispadix]|uniref:Prolyl oligopeptidase family serine peptidase n=1 Tax=Streptomyces marispadix TaxID=2922868 RepID=A0ABS9T3J4_9ACTN|nr:prolyl oligopeptidase family serine peptidase [Streptomyces marispadix]MCH6163099.1 prolyl oligopeptidase family serine peptidase [Streptomyces marispadix]
MPPDTLTAAGATATPGAPGAAGALAVRPSSATADEPRELDRETVHFGPGLTMWAVLRHARQPSVDEYHPASEHWRDLIVDPVLGGVAPARARHARVTVGGARRARPWELPVRTLLAAGLAWHPRLPILAGLVQRNGALHPWTADYADERLTVYEEVRAALSLSCRRPGLPTFAWCADGELALLTRPFAERGRPPMDGADDLNDPHDPRDADDPHGAAVNQWSPVVYEAEGPRHVAFLPGLGELRRIAGASVSLLHPATGVLRTLTPPLLVGGLAPSPDGSRLLVEHATAAHGEPVPAPRSGDGLGWSRAVLPADDGEAEWTPVPASTRWAHGLGHTLAAASERAEGTVVEVRNAPAAEVTSPIRDDAADTSGLSPRTSAARAVPTPGVSPVPVSAADASRTGELPAAHRLSLPHGDDDPPRWWACVTVSGGPVVLSRHRAGLLTAASAARPGTDSPADRLLRLPDGLERLGPFATEYEGGVVVQCVREGRAGFLVVDPARGSARTVLEPPPELPPGEGGPALESARASADGDGPPRLVVCRGGRFRCHELHDGLLKTVDAPVPEKLIAAGPAPTAPKPPALGLPPARGGVSARLSPLPHRTDRAGTGREGTDPECGDPAGTGPEGADDPVTTGQLLWLHVRRAEPGDSGTGASAEAVPHLTDLRAPAALLDLPLHWPDGARAEELRQQIVHGVEQAVTALRGTHGRTGPVIVGGHSFAATVALVALAHCPDLAGAVAHSGCYNRTLTPEGFQYERRSYWQVPGLYRAFSALDFAGRLSRPVLLVHGCDDTNPSTPPDQAVGLYRAVVATGGRARLVLLPREGHTFRHRESLTTVTSEHEAWLRTCAAASAARTGEPVGGQVGGHVGG